MRATTNDRLQCTWMTSFSSVQYTYCISSASERKETWNCMHFLVILSLNSLWAGVKHWRTALHRFYVYRKPISSPRSRNIQKYISPPLPLPEEEGAYIFGMKQVPVSRNLKVIKKMCTFEVHLCMISHSGLILSGKPFNTFSMVRLNILQLRLTLTPLFTATHAFFFLSHHFFPMICDWGIFFYSRDPRFMSLIDSPWFVKFSKMANFNFRESWFGFFLFSVISDQNPHPFKVFVYGKGVQNTCRSKFTNIFFFNFHLYFRRHLPLMPPS